MALKKISLHQPKENNGRPRLDNFVAQNLPTKLGEPISKSTVRRLIVAGAVYLNGSRVRIASKPVFAGAKVDVHLDLAKLSSPAKLVEEKYTLKPEEILFEDDDFIAVNKPAGLPTQPTVDKARRNLFNCVKDFLRERGGGDPYVGLHHRLDRDTSGVVLFTKSQRANAPLAQMFQDHTISKTYIAVCENRTASLNSHPEVKSDSFTVTNHLKKDPRSANKMAKFVSTTSGGDYAETQFKVLERRDGFLLVEAMPKTGRTHQIRVHLSELGIPVAGDLLYGAHSKNIPRFLLHARRLEFQHPFTNLAMTLEAPVPSDLTSFWESVQP